MTLRDLISSLAVPEGAPLTVAACGPSGVVSVAVSGFWPDGSAVTIDDPFYVASLAKQVTGVGAAVLVREGRLDPDRPVSAYVSDLPDWARYVSSRHLLNHTSGMPGAGTEPVFENWTTELARTQIRQAELIHTPGSAYAYSNLAYVLLAQILAEIAGLAFSDWSRTRLFDPLRLDSMCFRDEPDYAVPQLALLGASLPLTQGDGGLWSTATDYCRWLHYQNIDTFGIEQLVTTPARLGDGRRGDYGWGIGLRERNGQQLLIHAGEWTGATARAVRSPSTRTAVCAFASGLPMSALAQIVDLAWHKTTEDA